MKLEHLADEALLISREREDQADNLERSIGHGHVKRQLSEVTMMRTRLPAMRAAARALQLAVVWRERLPPEFVAEVERDAQR